MACMVPSSEDEVFTVYMLHILKKIVGEELTINFSKNSSWVDNFLKGSSSWDGI